MSQQDALDPQQVETVQQFLPLVEAIVQVVQTPEKAEAFEPILEQMEASGLTKLVHVTRLVIAGERDTDKLYQDLNNNETIFTQILLRAINNQNI